MPLNVTNFAGLPLLIGGYTVDQFGREAEDLDAPVRMIFIWGSGNLSSGGPLFTVAVERYGFLTINDLSIENNLNVGAIKQVNFLALSVDETDIGWYGAGVIDGHADPARPDL